MNKKTLLLAGLALGCSMAVAGLGIAVGASKDSATETKADTEYEYVETALSAVVTGDTGIIVGKKSSSYYALSNDKGTSNPPQAVSVTVANQKLSGNPASNLKWVVSNNKGKLSFQVPSTTNYLYCTNTNNGVRVGTNTNNVFSLDSNYLKNDATSRYVGIYNNSDWRCYTSINANIENQTFKFYKYTPVAVPVTGVSLDKESLDLEIGDIGELTPTITPANATNKNVSWSAAPAGIVNVEDGLVEAIGVGEADVTVTTEDGNKTATCHVTVTGTVVPVESVSLNKESTEIVEGQDETLTATVLPTDASNKNISWSSSNEAVATVNNGTVHAVKAGTATITVTTQDGSKTATCDVTVKANVVESIAVKTMPTKTSYYVGDNLALNGLVLTATYTDEHTEDVTTGYTVVDNPSPFTNADLGEKAITVSYQEKTTSFNVNVKKKVIVTNSIGGGLDTLDNAFIGTTGQNYVDFSGKTVDGGSGAVYAGNSAGDNSSVQLRSKNSNSGIVTTVSGGAAKKVTVVWESHTAEGRTLDIYGKNSAYEAATDLYNNSSQGTKLGSIVCGTDTELTITGNYTYLGLRSYDGAMYLDSLVITWDASKVEAIAADTDVAEVDEYIDAYLNFENVLNDGSCKTNYWPAAEYFNSLTADQKNIILTSNSFFKHYSYTAEESDTGVAYEKDYTYADVKLRLETWAEINGKTFDDATNTFDVSKASAIKGVSTKDTAPIIAIAAIIGLSALATGGFMLAARKRRKEF